MPEPTAEQISLRAPSVGETAHIRAEPPKARFVNATDADGLKIGEVDELLKDYQRLAKILDGLRIVGEEEAEAETEAEPTAS
jgi:hypothetical protein